MAEFSSYSVFSSRPEKEKSMPSVCAESMISEAETEPSVDEDVSVICPGTSEHEERSRAAAIDSDRSRGIARRFFIALHSFRRLP